MVNKSCEICNHFMENVHHSKKYCENCRKEALKRNKRKHHAIHKDDKKKEKETNLIENFKKVVKEGFHLTGKGFNSVSKIKCKAYTQVLDKKWVEILKDYNKYDDLVNYVVNSYKLFYNETNKINLHDFAKWNKYCSYDILIDIGIDEIKKKANIQKLRYSDVDYIENFRNVMKAVGYPPLYTEFEKYSKININSYANKYNLKGKVYRELMKMLLNNDQYDLYLKRYKEHKSKVGAESGILSATFTDKDYQNEFKRVITLCEREYSEFPSRRLFNRLSNFDDSMYRRKYNKSWLEICEMYGYQVERNHKAEKMLLNLIKDLTGCNYIPQETWEWLIGVGGKHLYCDGYFNKLNLVIEFDGVQHRKPVDAFGGEKAFNRLQQNDKLKGELLNKNGIKLIRISSNSKWYDKDYIREILIKNDMPILTPTS